MANVAKYVQYSGAFSRSPYFAPLSWQQFLHGRSFGPWRAVDAWARIWAFIAEATLVLRFSFWFYSLDLIRNFSLLFILSKTSLFVFAMLYALSAHRGDVISYYRVNRTHFWGSILLLSRLQWLISSNCSCAWSAIPPVIVKVRQNVHSATSFFTFSLNYLCFWTL